MAPLQVTLTDSSASLTIDNTTVIPNFSEGTTTCGSGLAANTSCTIDVAFSPTTGGLGGTRSVRENTGSGSQSVERQPFRHRRDRRRRNGLLALSP